MPDSEWKRREFIKTLLASTAFVGLDWESLPFAKASTLPENQYDAVIIGSGLGGLSCAAAFARQGFKALVVEQHDKPGGYATSFKRPGGFEFDVSLHSTTVDERKGVHNLIPGFPEIADVEFVPHPTLYRAIFPENDIRVPNRDLPAYIALLSKDFPAEKDAIKGLFDDMKALNDELGKVNSAPADYSRFPVDFPHVYRYSGSTWGQIIDARIHDEKLKGIISSLWGYFGLPPSRLASIYYALPLYGYLTGGGYYPKGRSQTISNAFVNFIEAHGGKVMLNTRVETILVKNGAAYGVRTAHKHEYLGKVIVSNANAWDTFHTMMQPGDDLKEYLAKMDKFSVSLSSFQVFLGLKRDLVSEVGIRDSEIFYTPTYDT